MCPSGTNIGQGMTTKIQWLKTKFNFFIADSPGLADIDIQKECAEEINKGFQADGDYKLIFVITLENGRIRPDDITTINFIMESIEDCDDDIPFGIIVNQVH